MSYSEDEQKDILQKVLKITIRMAAQGKPGFAPDILIEPAIEQAHNFIKKYQDLKDFDIWLNGRLDYYTRHLIQRLLIEYMYDYELSEENFEAVNALIEAEEMLGEKATDTDLINLFDYTPEELERLRIITQYLNGIDCDEVYKKYAKKLAIL